jgi:hypothetical protein
MTTDTALQRKTLRAAVRIHEHLVGSGLLSPLPVLYEHEWQELGKTVARFEVVRERGWKAAAESLLSDLEYSAAALCRRLESFQKQLPKMPTQSQNASVGEIMADIAALTKEFEKLEIDLKETTLSVVTPDIWLEDMYLGSFQIVLDWSEIGRGPCYTVVAKEPQPASSNDEVTHPHVSGNTLCEGDGSLAIRSALKQGRLLDFFTLVKQVLETYNSDSAYVSLSRWNGGEDCGDCGDSMTADESWCCEHCSTSICDDCRKNCNECDVNLCSGCCWPCHECEENFCRRCLVFRPGTQILICKQCLKKGENSDENESPADDPALGSAKSGDECTAPADDSVCLEEALVPA